MKIGFLSNLEAKLLIPSIIVLIGILIYQIIYRPTPPQDFSFCAIGMVNTFISWVLGMAMGRILETLRINHK